MTSEVLSKLEEAFMMGCSDREACLFAGIGTATLYNYQKENPDFVERKDELKENPILIARTSVMRGLKGDPDLALKFLERKNKAEFSLRSELTGAEGKPLIVVGEVADKHNLEADTRAS